MSRDHDHADTLETDAPGSSTRKQGLIEVPTGVFVQRFDVNMAPLPPIAFFVFSTEGVPKQIRAADQPFSPLALSAYETIWIREEDFHHVRKYAESVLTNPKLTANLPVEKRIETLQRAAIVVVEDIFANPSPENLSRGVKVVSSFVHTLVKEPHAYLMLSRLSSHDPYTLQHSIGTAVNCIILAKKAGVSNPDELNEVGVAGLLHDVGKVHVRTEIINKPGPLDDLEWEEMRQHSSKGYDIVKDHPHLSPNTKRAILEHHEEQTGKGYPKGLKPEEVHLFSKIVCLCDIFNALTTNRSYAAARTPFEAFQLMREKLSHKFDAELFKKLVQVYGGAVT
jgi:HD-GYP domain-containing protein (c-di-GMP phosphodiesterase class II)